MLKTPPVLRPTLSPRKERFLVHSSSSSCSACFHHWDDPQVDPCPLITKCNHSKKINGSRFWFTVRLLLRVLSFIYAPHSSVFPSVRSFPMIEWCRQCFVRSLRIQQPTCFAVWNLHCFNRPWFSAVHLHIHQHTHTPPQLEIIIRRIWSHPIAAVHISPARSVNPQCRLQLNAFLFFTQCQLQNRSSSS